ncbi:hypothetical protein JDV09_12515 [Mycobacterium sp. Y57]|uniref:hypothetical protein n=1 Tax=Mycolicibacterium xanthum TaxID=2796469 RepID=UPI001C851A20|nr:hypothetical protein [Mycolicibacterium xanthum]MBX7432924.1 hypothetical protein [Mycolicibacterium xanthum]
MAQGWEHVYADTRRQLRGVAESLIAGPQYRSAGTIRLAVRPDGFSGTALPMSVRGRALVWPDGSAPLAGPVVELARASGVDPGPPEGVYEIVDALPDGAILDIDAAAAELLYRSLYAGGYALKQFLPEQHPILWPEHFDVAVSADEVNYGVSAGDDHHPGPYAYVGPWKQRNGAFWNAPFGALLALDPAHDVDALTSDVAEFFRRGRGELDRSAP